MSLSLIPWEHRGRLLLLHSSPRLHPIWPHPELTFYLDRRYYSLCLILCRSSPIAPYFFRSQPRSPNDLENSFYTPITAMMFTALCLRGEGQGCGVVHVSRREMETRWWIQPGTTDVCWPFEWRLTRVGRQYNGQAGAYCCLLTE